MNEMNKIKESIFSLGDINVEVWDQASCQKHVLQVENQFINLALSQQEMLPPTLL